MERMLSSSAAVSVRVCLAGPSRLASCRTAGSSTCCSRATRVVVADAGAERDRAGTGAGTGKGAIVGAERGRVVTRAASSGEADAFLSPGTLLLDVEKMFEKGQPSLIPGSIDDAQSLPELFAAVASGGQINQEQKAKVLKINVDLMLYRARGYSQQAYMAKNLARRKQLLDRAEAAFRRCLEWDLADGRAYVGLGKLLMRSKRPDEARLLFEEGTRMAGMENPYIWQAWATLEERQGNLVRARKLFDAATAADRTHAAAWHGWGMLEKAAGNPERARGLFLRGLRYQKLGQPNEYLYQSIAVLAMEMRNVEEARLYFREGTLALAEANRSASALWQAWGLLERDQNNFPEARRLFNLALRDAPRNRFVFLAWGEMEASQGNSGKARYLLRRGHKWNPSDPALLQAWGRLEASAGKLDKARYLFNKGVQVCEEHQPLYQAWGMMEWKEGNLDVARDLFQRGVWADPVNRNATRVFQAWGVLEGREGNTKLARQLFKCAVKADPKSVPSWQSWAAMEEAAGNERRADELRALCLQQTTVQGTEEPLVPLTFGVIDENMADSLYKSVKQIAKWFKEFDDVQSQRVKRKIQARDSSKFLTRSQEFD